MLRQVFITIIILSISIGNYYNQNSTDSQGRKQGAWVKYHPDGKTPRYKGQFKDDKPYGEFVYYYETGEVQTVLEYQTDGTAIAKTYFQNGSLMTKGSYLNQQKEGVWWYFSADKLVIGKETYKNGKLDGVSYKFFPTEIGQQPIILEEITYVNGLAQGTWTRYYKDGKTQVRGKYKDGQEVGECIWYTVYGKPEIIGYYQHGVKNGWWRYFDTDGKETKKFYLNGNELKGEALDKYIKAHSTEQQ